MTTVTIVRFLTTARSFAQHRKVSHHVHCATPFMLNQGSNYFKIAQVLLVAASGASSDAFQMVFLSLETPAKIEICLGGTYVGTRF